MSKLEDKIKDKIKQKEGISISEFMSFALSDEEYGYYKNKAAIGKKGDFITAPEITSMFGEIIGLFLIERIESSDLKNAEKIDLVEMGAGNAVLLYDIISCLKKRDFFDKIKIKIIDINKELIKIQKSKLKEFKSQISWYEKIEELEPKTPKIFVMNEFFDALPVNQYYKNIDGIWQEKLVILDGNELTFSERDIEEKHINKILDQLKIKNSDIKPNSYLEYSFDATDITEKICKYLEDNKGLLISFDYGYNQYSGKDSLQAVKNHKYSNILKDIGESDITYWVDFSNQINICDKYDLKSYFFTQAEFLRQMGIEYLAQMKKFKNQNQSSNIDLSVKRLMSKDQMGCAFKVIVAENI
jgi:cyclopropane-fatty-acyl-phospholipid synthase